LFVQENNKFWATKHTPPYHEGGGEKRPHAGRGKHGGKNLASLQRRTLPLGRDRSVQGSFSKPTRKEGTRRGGGRTFVKASLTGTGARNVAEQGKCDRSVPGGGERGGATRPKIGEAALNLS